ncbi:myosin heavy chain kinase D, partial [Aplysia californica]|uniref:Myosin heavy chain kinase D n=1 Tax=Aplysia californica TaxID=6500 RepID=A0ABM0K2D2_APLCA
METSGISIISAKTLPSETAAVAYNNPAFDDDNGNTDAKNGITTATTAPSNTSTTTNNNNSSNNSSNNNSNNAPRMSSSDKGPRLYDDISHSKRGSSSVDFTMPEKKPRDRLKSLTTADGPYRGMGKEELLRYSSKPLWRNLRYVCMSIVLTGWLALLITVVALVLTYPQCREAQDREWWQKAVIYRVYVRSFLDAEGSDGIGDINGMHITVDFIPNHTSDQHPWFISSQANPDGRHNEFRSYYVWAEGGGPLKDTPINNW